MKKNAMLKIAAILLVAVLLTTCAISATFAKYVTKSEMTVPEEARVARWGITVAATANSNFFKQTYTNQTQGQVVASTESKVVAPGTQSDDAITLGVTFDGTPEVAYKIDANVTVDGEHWPTDYFPIKFKLSVGDSVVATCEGASPEAVTTSLNAELETLFNEDGKGIDTAKTVKITWEWPFSVNEANDIKDTNVANQDDLPTISVKASIAATQIGVDFSK